MALDFPALDPEDDLLAELEGPEPPWDEEPDAPPDPERVNGMLARLARIERERREDVRIGRAQIEQVEAWMARRDGPRNRQEEWLRRSLQAYHEKVFALSKTKSISLPNGELVSRQQQPTWVFDDEAAFLAWAEKHCPEAVRQKPPPPPEIDKNEAKAALTRKDGKGKVLAVGVTEAGEKPPGLIVIPGERSFDVKLNAEGQ